MSRAVDDAQDVALRTGLQAGEAADAEVGVDLRVERGWLLLSLRDGALQGLAVPALAPVPRHGRDQHRGGEDGGGDAEEGEVVQIHESSRILAKRTLKSAGLKPSSYS